MSSRRPQAEDLLSRTLQVPIRLEADPAALSAQVTDGEQVAYALAELSRAGVPVATFALGQPSLDEVFLALTGRPAEPEQTGALSADESAKTKGVRA